LRSLPKRWAAPLDAVSLVPVISTENISRNRDVMRLKLKAPFRVGLATSGSTACSISSERDIKQGGPGYVDTSFDRTAGVRLALPLDR
jgi:hypothetical protein